LIDKTVEPKKPWVPIDLDTIDLKILQDEDLKKSEEYLYTRKSHPLFKVLQTLMLLADVFSCRLHSDEAIKIFDYVQRQYMKLLGSNHTISNSYLIQ
jgi:hypothetical protein